MADNKWETVHSKSSKKSHKSNSNGVSNKKTDIDAPKVPVFGEKSQYEALTPKEKKAAAPKESAAAAAKPKSSIPRLQKKESAKKAKSPKLETAIQSIDGAQFEEIYSRAQQLFKDTPLVWLKELTGQLNVQLDLIPQSDYTFSDSAEDFPSRLLKPDVRKVFNKSIRECSGDLLEIFLEQIIHSTLTEIGKGSSVFGYQMVVQLVAKYKPELFSLNADKYVTTLVNNKNVPAKCLVVMWMLGQGGSHHFKSGLKVWVSLMLPVVGIKSLAPYSISYLSRLLQNAGSKIEQGYNVIEMKDYFLFFDGVFVTNKNVPVAQQKKLKEHYPTFKKLAFGKNPKDKMLKFFPSFLTRLSTDQVNPDLHRELLDNIVFCLVSDVNCLAVWKQSLYTDHLQQSSVLLDHLATNWRESASLGLNYKLVRQTVKDFTAINAKLNRATPGLDACISACARFEEAHTEKVQSSRSTMKSVVGLSLLTLTALVALDVYSSAGFTESRVGGFLKETGADMVIYSVYSQLASVLYSAATFLFSNVPVWLEAAFIYCEPLLDTLWNYIAHVVDYVILVCTPIRNWIVENVPHFIDWVIMHPVWEVLYNLMMSIKSVLQPCLDIILVYISPVLDKLKLLLF